VPEDEAIRDLSRARETAMIDLKDAKFQLEGFLLKNNIKCAVIVNFWFFYIKNLPC